MNLILFDDPIVRNNLLPFTFTRPVADIRFGILTIRQKWEKVLSCTSSSFTEDYLREKFPLKTSLNDNFCVNGSVCPNPVLIEKIRSLKPGTGLYFGSALVAFNSGAQLFEDMGSLIRKASSFTKTEYTGPFVQIRNPWDIFSLNGAALKADYELLTKGRKSAPLSPTNTVLGKDIFLEEGARVECSVLNTQTGPIYIGKDAEIMEGALIRGPFALCESAGVKMGAKIYGPTTIGPHSKVGGEVNNSVIFGYSNKGHDGFLGNSVLGEWCNLGADTNNSNLKNNYGEVQIYSYAEGKPVKTGLQFCGLMMGDHSKTGINTMLNTGTVVGVCANLFGGGFPETFVPDFTWGGKGEMETYRLDKALEVAGRVFERRALIFNDIDRNILSRVFELTARLRKEI
jgi:UDP-N-acetylglucosamine diphosphorylase/glucosamine-1-phosphate N-acetyltransferase